jgi:molybdate transport system substrate-binding protein
VRAEVVGLAVVALILGGCAASAPARPSSASASGGSAAASSAPVELVVYGAGSLKGVLAEAERAYEAANPGVIITVSTDSSATLATQIEQGAPADVFLSADTANPERLAAGGLAAALPVAFAGNELAVIVPLDNPAGLTSAMDLVKPGLKIIAAGPGVPLTAYAAQLVANLGRQTLAPQLWIPAYEANVVSREDNVKAVVAKIELGEGDAAIVYATDALASERVATLPIPAGANVAAAYSGLVVASSNHPAEAGAFLEWFAGPGGAAILERAGFLPAP